MGTYKSRRVLLEVPLVKRLIEGSGGEEFGPSKYLRQVRSDTEKN